MQQTPLYLPISQRDFVDDAFFLLSEYAGSPYPIRNLNLDKAGTFPNGRLRKILPSETGLLKYSACTALADIPARTVLICSSVFFAGQVDFPLLSRMLTISQLFAIAPARAIQQSLAMILPHQSIRVGSEIERVGQSAPSNQSHFFLRVSGLRQSSSVSQSSRQMTSGRTASFLAPRGALPAPSATNLAPQRHVKSVSVHCPTSC